MVVTGDRDMFQLIEPGVRVMATSRGITETKVYDRDAVIDRYGIAPELIPDFVRAEGRHLGQHPRRPGHRREDRLAAAPGARRRSRACSANIDKISGAKRKENLTNHAEDARVSKTLATAIRDIDLGEIDLDHIAAREPDRSRLRETFREFELRAPLERLEEALGEGEAAAPAERAEEVVHTKARAVPLAEIGALEGELVALAARAPASRRRAGRPGDAGRGRPAARADGGCGLRAAARCSSAEAETLTALTMARGERPVVDPRLEDHGGERGGRAAPWRSSTTRWSPPT